MAGLGLAVLALISLVMAGLLPATRRGLDHGSLLAPEPAVAIRLAAASAS